MEIDDAVQEEVWKGAIPIRISLSTLDIASHETPPDYYTLIPRSSYLPLILEPIKAHFEPYVSTDFTLDSIWFTYNSTPLKWHYPTGVLADLLLTIQENTLILQLPLHLVVNFHRFPTDVLLPYNGLKSIRGIFQNSIKEACALLLGTSGPVMNLSRDQEDDMWKSIGTGDFKAFKEIGRDFMKLQKRECRLMPIRITYRKLAQGFMLRPISAAEVDTVGALVERVVPGFSGVIVIQGIEVPREAEVFWLWRHLAHPDNFLYVTLVEA